MTGQKKIYRGARPKKLWITIHLYIGLTLGLAFAALGLTGSLNVYSGDLDHIFNPHLFSFTAGPVGPGPPDFAKAKYRYEDLKRIEIPTSSPNTLVLELSGDAPLDVHVDRASGRSLGTRLTGSAPSDVLLVMHDSFMLPFADARLSGIVGLALLASVLSGVYIWWPGRRRILPALTINRPTSRRRFYYQLHRLVGAIAAIFLLLSCVTGLPQAFPDILDDSSAYRSGPIIPTHKGGYGPVSLFDAWGIASSVFPDADFRRADRLDGQRPEIRVILNSPKARGWRRGDLRLWIDASNGRILRIRRATGGPALWLNWFPALHNGDAAGRVGRLMMFAAGLAPLILFLTGTRLWWLRRRRPMTVKVKPLSESGT